MTKRWQNITINNQPFELDTKQIADYPNQLSYRDIDDCYTHCSSVKRAIWQWWHDWFFEYDGYCEVASYNCMMFTISGFVTDKETGRVYSCYITKAHNYAIEITD